MKTEKYPISKYVGTFPKGEWVFVKNFKGTVDETHAECARLQKQDPKTGRKKNSYCIWDNR